MMDAVIDAARATGKLQPFEVRGEAVNCHHNYVAREHHFGKNVFVTRKGAVRARLGDLGIIPGTMGARSYIVRGKGNAEAFHARATARAARCRDGGEEAVHARGPRGGDGGHRVPQGRGRDRRDARRYKSIDEVMEAQGDLVESSTRCGRSSA